VDDIVVVEELHFAYPPLMSGEEPVPVLKGINLRVRRGECLAIMGPTGAGKTTLCLALNGIVPHLTGGTFEGSVTVAGMNTRNHGPGEMSRIVGIVFQNPESQLFNMTVEDEVAFGPEGLGLPRNELRERVDWALRAVGIEHLRRRSPLQLSGGQKQRVALASILAIRPQVLVLDEPTAELDPLGRDEFFAALRELRAEAETTVIMVEQDGERVAEFADRVVVLVDGKVKLEGTPKELFSQVELVQEMGLDIPQVSELAHKLNQQWGTNFTFLTEEEALCKLSQLLEG